MLVKIICFGVLKSFSIKKEEKREKGCSKKGVNKDFRGSTRVEVLLLNIGKCLFKECVWVCVPLGKNLYYDLIQNIKIITQIYILYEDLIPGPLLP